MPVGSSAPQLEPATSRNSSGIGAAVPGTPSMRASPSYSTAPPRRRHVRDRHAAGVHHVDAHRRRRVRRRHEPVLDGQRPDAGEDVAAVLAVADLAPCRPRPAGTDSRRRHRPASTREMTATLLVSGCAPPMPSIWRASGEPIAASSTRRAAARSAGRSSREEIEALRRAAAHQRAGDRGEHRVSLFRVAVLQALLGQRARACRRCRARARRPRAAPALPLPSARARCDLSSTSAACSRAHDADAVVVGDDRVAGIHERAGADDRHVHAAERLLDRALRGDRIATRRETASRSARARRARRPR